MSNAFEKGPEERETEKEILLTDEEIGYLKNLVLEQRSISKLGEAIISGRDSVKVHEEKEPETINKVSAIRESLLRKLS